MGRATFPWTASKPTLPWFFWPESRAYKIKRAVKYPFLDFSTLENRHRALVNELAINRRTAPQLYLDVIPITVGESGEFRLGGEGDAIEWALVMRRFDQAKLYDRMAEEGRLPLSVMPQLAQVIADFHRGANRFLAPETSVAALLAVLKDNETALAGEKDACPADALATVNRGSREALAALALLLQARASGGYVRHCHGDLHLRNIVEIDGAPVLFDAIEFDDAIATVDVLYDLAFLLMDLGARGLRAHANAVLNAYLEASGDTGNLIGLAALPLFLSTRAMIRAKVELLRASLDPVSREEARRRATSYVLLARDYLERQRPQLIAIGGLSGSGKSSVAQALAPHLGVFPGAVHVRSDVERKRLFGVGAGRAAAPACLCRGSLRHRLHHVPQACPDGARGWALRHRRRGSRKEGGARRRRRDCGARRCRVHRHLARRHCRDDAAADRCPHR